MRNLTLKIYVTLVACTALVGSALMAIDYPVEEIRGWWVALIATFALGTQSVAFPRHRVQLTVSDSFMFYALVVHGPFAAVTVAFVGILGATLLGSRQLTAQQTIFNLGAVPLSAVLACAAFVSVSSTSAVLGLMVGSAVFFVGNTALVALVLTLEGRAPLKRAMRLSAPGFFLSILLTASAGSSLAYVAVAGPGEWMVAGVVGVCLLIGVVLSARRADEEGQAQLG